MQATIVLSLLLASVIGAQAVDYVQLQTTGTIPNLYWTSCWLQGNSFAVFGGTIDPNISSVVSGNFQASVHFLDLATLTWTTGANTNTYPVANVGDAVVVIDDKAYTWAGSTTTPPGNTGSRLAVFTIYDFATSSFSYAPNPVLPPYSTSSRGFASAVVTPNGGIAVFGGSQGTATYYRDFYEFNLAAQNWTNLSAPDDTNVPSARSGVATVTYQGKMYLFGGRTANNVFNDLYSYDFGTGRWSVVTAAGTPPTPRFASTNGLTSDGIWIIFGGATEKALNFYNDTYYLDLNTLTWSAPEVNATIVPPRTYNCAIQKDNTFYFFGGANNGSTLGDVWSYTYIPPTPTSESVSASGNPASDTANTAPNNGTDTVSNSASGNFTASQTDTSASTYAIPSDASTKMIGFGLLALAFYL